MLLSFFPHVKIVGKFTSVNEIITEMECISFDAIFVNIEMGDMQDVLDVENFTMQFPAAEIIFATAYPQYALKAFEMNAVDYLLKPVKLERLQKSIQRLEQRLHLKNFVNKSLRVKVMGHFHLANTYHKEVKWRTRKVKELFLYLLQHRNNPCTRMKILEDLWEELPEEKATALMHTTVYELRKCLKAIGVETPISFINEKYVLNVEVHSDLDVLLKAFSMSPVNASMVELVLELYTGDYLEEESYGWALHEQKKIKEMFLHYLQQFLDTVTVNGKHDYMVERCFDKMLQLDPYNEQVVCSLLDYFGNGRKKEKMVRLYDDFKRAWMDDLGLEIPKEVVDIYKKHIRA